MSFLKLLGFDRAPERDEDVATIRRIAAEVDDLPQERARYIAAFAFVLSRVAYADRTVTSEETAHMEEAVRELGGLPEAQAALVVECAKVQARLFGGTENFVVTRELASMVGRDEKLAIADALFALASADDAVTSVEESEIRLIVDALGLDHDDYIAARSRYRDRLAVLRRPQDEPGSRGDA